MLLAALFFATMGVCIKFASAHFNSFELVAYRGVIGLVFLAGLARVRGVSLRTAVPMMHLWRSVVGVISLVAWFYAIAYLPLATAMTLNYLSSVWIGAFLIGGALLMQRRAEPLRQQSPLYLAVLGGFAGVALVLRPSFTPEMALPAMVGVLSGLAAALAYLQVAALARVGEPEERTVFYFSLAAVVVGAVGALPVGYSPLNTVHSVWLLPMGLLAVFGQLCMTRAYTRGSTLVVANLQYSGIVFSAFFSLFIFGDDIPPMGWLGMGLIIVCGIAATALRERAVPNAPAEEHA